MEERRTRAAPRVKRGAQAAHSKGKEVWEMTIGERIAQKRKEQNLSQEALGEALGVSRQSISKWESNNALPEIEKLIAMSRLFSVSVGWLLGVEEAPAEDGGEAREGSDELSE